MLGVLNLPSQPRNAEPAASGFNRVFMRARAISAIGGARYETELDAQFAIALAFDGDIDAIGFSLTTLGANHPCREMMGVINLLLTRE